MLWIFCPLENLITQWGIGGGHQGSLYPVCKWAARPEWKWRPLTGKMREQPLWPTRLARLIICPCNHTQPRSSLILLVSESLCLAMLLEDAATQLDASGNLSRASNLPSSIKPTFPILNSFHKFDLEVKKSGLSDIYFKSNVWNLQLIYTTRSSYFGHQLALCPLDSLPPIYLPCPLKPPR